MIAGLISRIRTVLSPVITWKDNLLQNRYREDLPLEGLSFGIVITQQNGSSTPLGSMIQNQLLANGAKTVPVLTAKVASLAKMEVMKPPFSDHPLDVIIWGVVYKKVEPNNMAVGGYPSAGLNPPKNFLAHILSIKVFSREGYLITEDYFTEGVFLTDDSGIDFNFDCLRRLAQHMVKKISNLKFKGRSI